MYFLQFNLIVMMCYDSNHYQLPRIIVYRNSQRQLYKVDTLLNFMTELFNFFISFTLTSD